MKKKPVEEKNKYKYETSEIEAKYKIKINPEKERYQTLRKSLQEVGCPFSNGDRCMCKEFQEQDSTDYCKYGLYFKEERGEKAAEAYKNAEFKNNAKKEKDIEKQAAKEEKEANKENEE